MGKNKHNRNQTPLVRATATTPPAALSIPAAPPPEERITEEQTAELMPLIEQSRSAAAEEGVGADMITPAAQLAPTVKQAIKDATDAKQYYLAAKKKAEENRDKAAQAENAAQKRIKELEQQGTALREKRDELDARELKLLDREEAVGERERNAENGFLLQRRRVVSALEEQVEKLKAEVDTMAATAEGRRSKEEEAWRRRVEARIQAWEAEEEKRSKEWEQAQESQRKTLRNERDSAAKEIVEDRRRAEETLKEEKDAHAARIAAEQAALELQRTALLGKERELLRLKNDLTAEREDLEENKRGLQSKVERLAAGRVAQLEDELRAERERLSIAEETKQRYWGELESRRALDRQFGDMSPPEILDRLRQSERRTEELEGKLRESLGRDSARRLASLERERSTWLEERAVLEARLADATARAERLRIGAVELQNLRDAEDVLKARNRLLEQALKELRAEIERFTQADVKRSPLEALSAIDRDSESKDPVRTVPPGEVAPTLKDFAENLRHLLVTSLPGRKLYYTERHVRSFLGGLAMSKLLLLQGISGTGKTSLPLAFARAIGTKAEIIPVQAGWRDRQDLIGYHNAFHRHFYATNFLQALYRAGTPAYRDRPFLIVLDEINLSRVEQFFADFISALEHPEDERELTLMDDRVEDAPLLVKRGRVLPIPPNVWFVGTANHDETTTEFADKTYDRAHIMELPRRDSFQSGQSKEARPLAGPLSYNALNKTFEEARKKHRASVEEAHRWLGAKEGIAPLLERRFRLAWGHRLDRDVELFVPVVLEAGGEIGEAMDHLIATKVLRKLRDRHDIRSAGLEALKKKLESAWISSSGGPEECLKLIDRELIAKHAEEADA